MIYTAVIAITDGLPDDLGDILGDNVTIPNRDFNVYRDFKEWVGSATVVQKDDKIVAEIVIDEKLMSVEDVEKLSGTIGGTIYSRNGFSIVKWTLTQVGLTETPADPRLPKLKRKL